MQTIFIVMLLLLILIAVLLILMIKKVPAFGKEVGEALLSVWTGVKDTRLTDEEKAAIKKEWSEVDWKAALKKLIGLSK